MNAARNELRILIADDDSATCSVLRLLLHEQGHRVVAEAHDGERAVELCEAHKPHIAFLDIDMPRLDGHAAAERIRKCAPGVGMIMVTSLPTMDNVQKALQAGVNGFVVKPFNAVKVVEAIGNCMKGRR
ncbi:response regulator [Herbaspirillum sp. HC18]|nr:response regulator [Herbaspirillum sp. HC18]